MHLLPLERLRFADYAKEWTYPRNLPVNVPERDFGHAGIELNVGACKIIPSLPPHVLVHVHDIFLPFDYPFSYHKQLWNEQYVLQAVLAHAAVVFATHFMSRTYPEEMQLQEVFGAAVGVDKDTFGASFWFRS
jgi:hypothetical protein